MVTVPGPVLVVSPHMDDAVLSCGELIPQLDDCVVMTVFAGAEGVDWSIRRGWDAENSGIPVGTDVVSLRIAEDDDALSRLDAGDLPPITGQVDPFRGVGSRQLSRRHFPIELQLRRTLGVTRHGTLSV